MKFCSPCVVHHHWPLPARACLSGHDIVDWDIWESPLDCCLMDGMANLPSFHLENKGNLKHTEMKCLYTGLNDTHIGTCMPQQFRVSAVLYVWPGALQKQLTWIRRTNISVGNAYCFTGMLVEGMKKYRKLSITLFFVRLELKVLICILSTFEILRFLRFCIPYRKSTSLSYESPQKQRTYKKPHIIFT